MAALRSLLKQRDALRLLAAVVFVIVFESILIVWVTGGNFTYTLDDAYIHMALAENLARFGHYGINSEEYSAASSSILWPFLLVPFFKIGLVDYGPFILNVLFAMGSALTLLLVLSSVADDSDGEQTLWPWALLLFLSINGFGLVFTGMEHSLHVLLTLLIVYSINRILLGATTNDSLLVFCIVASPLIRFEGIAVSAFGILMLVVLRKARLGFMAAALICFAFAAYFAAMSRFGLGWLPSSVLVKLDPAADLVAESDLLIGLAGAGPHVAENFIRNLATIQSWPLIGIAAYLAWQSWMCRREPRIAVYAAGAFAVIVLHLAFGRFGWYGRYQPYIYAFAICAGLFLWHHSSSAKHRPIVSRNWKLTAAFLGPTVLILNFEQSLWPVITTPVAAQNIYGQHYQMHRFATRQWQSPVAVNDIGYVSFRNDQYVLDLWGLGSEEARQLMRANDRDRLRKLTAEHDVHLAMIYERGFPGLIPSEWIKIGELRLNSKRITSADSEISFYVFGLGATECSTAADTLLEFSHGVPVPNRLSVDRTACERSLNASR